MRLSMASQTEWDHSSSPDPLASSMLCDNSSAPKSKHTRKGSSQKFGAARKSIDDVSILPPSSPSRTVTEQTLSPWKIRVTVETEPEDQTSIPIETVTRTIQIPLRGGSSPAQEVVKGTKDTQSQSRPRKSANVKQRQCSVTPTAERRRRQSVTDLDIVVLGDDADEDEWGKKQRKSSPRKSRAKKSIPKSNQGDTATESTPQFDVRQDTDVEENSAYTRDDTPELRQIDLNRVSIRPRSNSTKQKVKFSHDNEDAPEDNRYMKPVPDMAINNRRTVSANSALTYPTPSPTASERGRSVEVEEFQDNVRDHAEGFDTIMESEGFTMIDLETLPSVKQMLSSPIDGQISNPYAQSLSPAESDSTVRRNISDVTSKDNESRTFLAKAIPPHLVLPEGESEISSTVPSSPPTFQARSNFAKQKSPLSSLQVPHQSNNRKVTPQTYSSPKLPSPPRQPTLKDRSTPDSAKAMRAGLALQSAVEPKTRGIVQHHVTPNEINHARSSSDELFEGFDSGTKRELRAGLRFGEELAKRQPKTLPNFDSDAQPPTKAPSQIWRGESVISRTPVQTEPNKLSTTSSGSTQKSYRQLSNETTPLVEAKGNLQHLNTAAKREHLWALERQAVSKQIEEASPSKVIVIDSDDEHQEGLDVQVYDESMQDATMNDDGGDIWLEEAKDSSSPRQEQELSDPSVGSDESSQLEVGGTEERPRRSLIPSPWKRGEQVEEANHSTILTNGEDISGMLWKQTAHDDILFGAAAINNVRRELGKSETPGFSTRRMSGSFNIDKMLGTPKRIRESLDREYSLRAEVSHPQQSLSFIHYNQIQTDEIEESDSTEESSQLSEMSNGSSLSSRQQLQLVPADLDDPVSSTQQTTPRQNQSRTTLSPSAVRPPTPRSAMKGARQSFGAAKGLEMDEQDYGSRRVIFAQRSKGVDIDWVESSSSIRSSAEQSSSPIVEHQKHHEERQIVLTSSPKVEHKIGQEDDLKDGEASSEKLSNDPDEKGWLGWIWKGKQPDASLVVPATQVDGTAENPATQPANQSDRQWKPTTCDATFKQSGHKRASQIPSYLLSPSYPSDPTRSTTTSLSTSGKFSNYHFRTLHILHRKSRRPRFHAPKFSSCRPEIRELAVRKWKLEIDESDAGLGGFAWTVGETEARVLERFCREIEFDHLRHQEDDVESLQETVSEWLDGRGIWGGNVGHGSGSVKWKWQVTDLANWLGRTVVGEVVREEEYGGNKHKA